MATAREGTTGGRSGRAIRDLPSALDRPDEIRAVIGSGPLVVFLDYDGTLTPIVDDPAAAVLSADARTALRDLATSRRVAVLSGRDLEDVRRLVDLPELVVAGSHGFEIETPDGRRFERAPEFLLDLDQAEAELAPLVSAVDGALLDRKRFAIAVHVRRVDPSRVADLERAVELVAERHPRLRRTGGKKVLELRPGIEWDKGTALLWLLDLLEPGAPNAVPLYVGDDETDEDAFRAIRGRGIGIVVAGEGDDRTTGATYVLAGPGEVPRLLRALRNR